MNEDKNEVVKDLWEMRHLSVEEFIKNLSNHPDLKFLITTAGVWFVAKMFFCMLLLGNLIYFVYQVFSIVLS